MSMKMMQICLWILTLANALLMVCGQGPAATPIFSECGGGTSALRGVVTSPGYPDSYENNRLCLWTVSTPGNGTTTVEISITEIGIENSLNCQYDYVSITFYLEEERRFCGGVVDDDPLSGFAPVDIMFVSDPTITGIGFRLAFEVQSPCLPEPCLNGATCLYESSDSDYECVCVVGYTGRDCEAEIDECESDPCENGGTCIDLFNAWDCKCQDGTSGDRCQVIDNLCFLEPCKNGTCAPLDGSYECNCDAGYEGLNCDVERNECISGPCLNGGICSDLLDSYSCTCGEQFSGFNCQEFIGRTTLAPTSEIPVLLCQDGNEPTCMNGGTCVEDSRRNLTSCICQAGYFGRSCESIRTDTSALLKAIIGAAVGVIFSLLVISSVMCYLMTARKHKKSYPSEKHRGAHANGNIKSYDKSTETDTSVDSMMLRSARGSPVVGQKSFGHSYETLDGGLASEISQCMVETAVNGVPPEVDLVLDTPFPNRVSVGAPVVLAPAAATQSSVAAQHIIQALQRSRTGKAPLNRHTWAYNTPDLPLKLQSEEKSDMRKRSTSFGPKYAGKMPTNTFIVQNEFAYPNKSGYLPGNKPAGRNSMPVLHASTSNMGQPGHDGQNGYLNPPKLRRNETAVSPAAARLSRELRLSKRDIRLNGSNTKNDNAKMEQQDIDQAKTRIEQNGKPARPSKSKRLPGVGSSDADATKKSKKRVKSINKIRERLSMRNSVRQSKDNGPRGFEKDVDGRRQKPEEDIYGRTVGEIRQSASGFQFDARY